MSIDIHTIAHGAHSRIAEPRRAVVRSAGEWHVLWVAHIGPDVPAPPVDFQSRMVAAVFAGERPTPGYEVTITGVRQDGAEWLLLVDERRPVEGTLTVQVTTSPFHIVSLQRYDGRVEFADVRRVRAPRPAAGTLPIRRRHHEAAPSSTGLRPPVAGSLAYLAGPFSGALLLATETTSRFVRFHAWQALVALGVLGVAAFLCLGLAFVLLLFSPAAFWTLLWMAAIVGAIWVLLWAACLVQAYRGRVWKLPLAGDFAERRAGLK